MSDSNRVRLSGMREATLGTTPGSPRFRNLRFTGESLVYKPEFVTPEEIRSDRMNVAPAKVGESNSGGVNFEFHYPPQISMISELIESAFMNTWNNTPSRDNDGTADSVITNVAASGGVFTVTTGPSIVAGSLLKSSGFTNSGNNGINKVTTGSATVPAVGSSILTDEAVPPAAARLKVVGFEGASGDITATSSGVASTSLDFTTFNLAVGQWLKIGGSTSGQKFATAALNDWVRIAGPVTANAIPLDNLPSGWTTDAGTGKTIRVWFGDYIVNGTTKLGESLERGFLDQASPTYVLQKGMAVNKWTMNFTKKAKITGSFDFMGMGGSQSQTSVDSTTDAAPDPNSYPIMAASANVGRVAENGVQLASPNFCESFSFTLTNNYTELDAVDSQSAVDLSAGSCDVEVTCSTYFGDNTLLTKLFANTLTNANIRAAKNSQAVIFGFPALTFTEGVPNASKKNDQVMLPLKGSASLDATTNAQIIVNRLEFYV